MDANFERAKARRRMIDRRLMDGEFPILLCVIGKQGPDERYLSIAETNPVCRAPSVGTDDATADISRLTAGSHRRARKMMALVSG
jgi:hypothetical protein